MKWEPKRNSRIQFGVIEASFESYSTSISRSGDVFNDGDGGVGQKRFLISALKTRQYVRKDKTNAIDRQIYRLPAWECRELNYCEHNSTMRPTTTFTEVSEGNLSVGNDALTVDVNTCDARAFKGGGRLAPARWATRRTANHSFI